MSLTLATLTGVFQTVLSASLHAALLIVTVLLVQRLFRRQISVQCRYLLWLIVVGRLLFPILPQSNLSLLGLFQSDRQTDVFQDNPIQHARQSNVSRATPGVSKLSELAVPSGAEQPLELVASDLPKQLIASEPLPSVNGQPITSDSISPSSRMGTLDIASLVWLLGFVAFVGRDCILHFRTRRFIGALEHIPEPRLTASFAECKHEMRVTGHIRLLTCDRLIPPGIFGIFRTCVIVPRRLSVALSDEELRFLFLHELTHFQRRDVPIALVTSVLRCIHWFNPLMWYAEVRMTEDRELACDAAVLRQITPQQYQSYGETIVKVLEQLIAAKPAFGTVSMAQGKASMKRRLSMVSSFQESTWRQFGIGALLLFTFTVTGLSKPPITDAEQTVESQEQQSDAPPKHAEIRLGTDTLRHDGGAEFMGFSPDGKWIACSSRAGHVFIFDAATGKPVRRMEFSGFGSRVSGMQFSPADGSLVISVGAKIYFCSPATGEVLRTLTPNPTNGAAIGLTWTFELSKDGKQVALYGGYSHVCIVLDADSGKETKRLETRPGQVLHADFSPDGRSLAFASLDPGVKVWDLASRKLEHTLPGHDHLPGGVVKKYSMRLEYSPDGKTLATGANKEIFLWDVQTKQLRRKLLVSSKDLFNSIVFTPDSKTVVGGSQEGNVYVWDAETGRLRFELSALGSLHSVAISPDGTKLAASSWHSHLRVWDLRTGRSLFPNPTGHGHSVEAVKFSPNGNQIVSSSGSRQILFWDAHSGELLRSMDTKERSSSLHFLSDEKRLVSGWQGAEGITVWDSQTGERLRRFMQVGLPKNNHFMRAFQLSTDEKRLVVAGFDSDRFTLQFCSWDFENHRRSLKFIEGDIRVRPAIAISPNCYFAAIGYSKDVLIWDLRSGEQVAELKGHEYTVNSLAYSSDGERLVTGSSDRTVRIWDCKTFELLHVLDADQPIAVVAFSADDTVIAAAGGRRSQPVHSKNRSQVIFWDAGSGEKIGHVSGERANVTALGFSADGDRIVSGHQDGSLFVWHVRKTKD